MDLHEYFVQQDIPHDVIEHDPAYTADELARALHTGGEEVAKAVLVSIPDGYVIAIVPATHQIDLQQLRVLLGTGPVRLATRQEIHQIFPDARFALVPPLGSMYGLRTFIDVHLASCSHIVFEAGRPNVSVRVAYEDFHEAEQPVACLIAVAHHHEGMLVPARPSHRWDEATGRR